MKTYSENHRSSHALLIDRSLQAKKQYNDFNSEYKKAENRSDVEDWDDAHSIKRKNVKPLYPENRPSSTHIEVPKKEVRSSEIYKPNANERESLIQIFHKMNPIDQFKDLQTTRNVVHTEKQLKAWKENPKNGDVDGIDTRPVGYEQHRVKSTQDLLGKIPVWEYNKENRIKYNQEVWNQDHPGKFNKVGGALAFFAPYGKGYIFYKKQHLKRANFNNLLAHELGHYFDFHQSGKVQGKLGINPKAIRIGFPGQLSSEHTAKLRESTRKFNFYNEPLSIANRIKEVYDLKKGKEYEHFKLNSFKILSRASFEYMRSDKEQFANWFSVYLMNPEKAKKSSFYNVLKSGVGKSFHQGLRKKDIEFMQPFIKGKVF